MFAMNFDITIGAYRLSMLESVTVKSSVENLADTAVIVLPGSAYNRALEIESLIGEGDPVSIRLGYDARGEELPLEFEGFVRRIAADEGSIRIECEDAIRCFRKELKNVVLADTTLEELLQHVVQEVGGIDLACDYDFRYDKFAVYTMTGYDVLKKVQEETGANIYLREKTLHVHPQHAPSGRKVVYDFAQNIEKSDLSYKDGREHAFLVTVEGTDAAGATVKATKGTPGGDTFTLRLPGVSDMATLERRAEEAFKSRSRAGCEGSFTGWLVPSVAPGDTVELRDETYDTKTGSYYAVAVETSFSASGGSRKVTLGEKIG